MWRAIFLICSLAGAQSWQMQESGSTASLRGISAVSAKVAWASGSKGTILRTVDAGATWTAVSPAGAADADFRDIEAIDERTAYAMSAGQGRLSRIYKTTDGGSSWTLLRANGPEGFWDSFGMWDATHGMLLGDPVNGRFTILTTSDGQTWSTLEGPKAESGEAAFAASGTALIVRGTREAWFATGGPGGGRVFHTDDSGRNWTVTRTPIKPANEGAGIFSIAVAGKQIAAVGGDYQKPGESAGNSASSEDGSKWTTAATPPGGYRSAVAYAPIQKLWIAVGTSGSDVSTDARVWKPLAKDPLNAVSVARDGSIWAAGPEGRIAKLLF